MYMCAMWKIYSCRLRDDAKLFIYNRDAGRTRHVGRAGSNDAFCSVECLASVREVSEAVNFHIESES